MISPLGGLKGTRVMDSILERQRKRKDHNTSKKICGRCTQRTSNKMVTDQIMMNVTIETSATGNRSTRKSFNCRPGLCSIKEKNRGNKDNTIKRRRPPAMAFILKRFLPHASFHNRSCIPALLIFCCIGQIYKKQQVMSLLL